MAIIGFSEGQHSISNQLLAGVVAEDLSQKCHCIVNHISFNIVDIIFNIKMV